MPEHAPRHRSLGLQFIGDEEHDGGRGRGPHHRGDRRLEHVDAADEAQQREHRDE